MPIILTVGGIIIIAVALLRQPATKYLERGGKIPGLPYTKQKYLPSLKPNKGGEDAEHYLRRLDAEIKSLWNKSLDYDGIPRDSKFVNFSRENPYQKEYNELMTEKMKWQRIIKAGGGLQHHAGQQYQNMNYMASTRLNEPAAEMEYLASFDAEIRKWVPATKHDPLKFAESILSNNLFEAADLPLYNGTSGTNPMGVPDFIWQTAFAEAGGKFIKLGQLYTVAGGKPTADPGLAPETRTAYVEILSSGETELVPGSVVALDTVEKVNKKMKSLKLAQATYKTKPGGFRDQGGKTWPFPEQLPATQHTIDTDLKKSMAEEKQATEEYNERAKTAEKLHDDQTAALYREVSGEEKQHMDEFKRRLEDKDKLKYVPDSPEFMAQTIQETGWREKIDNAFMAAIERLKKK